MQVSLCRSVVSILPLSCSERYTSITNDNYFILQIHLYRNSMAKIVGLGEMLHFVILQYTKNLNSLKLVCVARLSRCFLQSLTSYFPRTII